MQTDHLIPTRRPNPVIINKKEKRACRIADFAGPGEQQQQSEKKKENESRDK